MTTHLSSRYFEQFGELLMAQIKRKHNGQSKGFAFIRFKRKDVQKKVETKDTDCRRD